MKLSDSKNRYQEIWSYLSNESSKEEEASLLDWVSASQRNSTFFNEVVADFNSFKALSKIEHRPGLNKIKKQNFWKYGVAASLLLLIISSILWIISDQKPAKLLETKLSNGIVITSITDKELDYDLENYMANGILKLSGKAWIHCPKGVSTIITVETSAGYYLLENAEAYIENNPSGNSTIQLFKGKARLISTHKGGQELGVRVGQKISFNKQYNAFTYSDNNSLISPI